MREFIPCSSGVVVRQPPVGQYSGLLDVGLGTGEGVAIGGFLVGVAIGDAGADCFVLQAVRNSATTIRQ